MADTPPSPPEGLPTTLVEALADCSPETLRAAATYADSLADYRDRVVDESATSDSDADGASGGSLAAEGEDAGGEGDDAPDDRPSEVPANATITIKEINDNRYYYWQWRDGDDVKSKYKGPVDPDE